MKPSLRARLDAFFFPVVPAERLGAVRVFIGGFTLLFLAIRGFNLAGYGQFPAHRFKPVGVVSLLDVPLSTGAVWALVAATVLTAIPFTLGWRFRFFGPLFAALLWWTTTYRQCWGMVFHTENLMVLYVAVLSLTPSAHAYALDARGRPPREPHLRYGWPLKLMATLLVLSYVMAGLAKLRISGWERMDGDVIRVQIAYDNVRKIELGALHAPFGAWLVQFGWLFPILGVASLALELGAPLALLGRRLAWVWSVSTWLFHFGVVVMMAILFAFPLSGCAFAPLFRAEVALERLRRTRLVQALGGR